MFRALLASLPKASVKALMAVHASRNCTLREYHREVPPKATPQKATPMQSRQRIAIQLSGGSGGEGGRERHKGRGKGKMSVHMMRDHAL